MTECKQMLVRIEIRAIASIKQSLVIRTSFVLGLGVFGFVDVTVDGTSMAAAAPVQF